MTCETCGEWMPDSKTRECCFCGDPLCDCCAPHCHCEKDYDNDDET